MPAINHPDGLKAIGVGGYPFGFGACDWLRLSRRCFASASFLPGFGA